MTSTASGNQLPTIRASPSAWMVTFSDLLMLLLTFCVLRFSMSSIHSQTFTETVSGKPSESAKPLEPNTFLLKSPELLAWENPHTHAVADTLSAALGMPEIEQAHGGTLRFRGAISLREKADTATLILGRGAFAINSAELTFIAAEALRVIAFKLQEGSWELEILAYTAEETSSSASYSSPWDLSIERALVAGRQFIDADQNNNRILIGSYQHPQQTSTSPGEPQAELQTRVEIRIRPMKESLKDS